jgi:hypothetical protein
MFCSQCGNSNAEDAKFCNKCGERLVSVVNEEQTPEGYATSQETIQQEKTTPSQKSGKGWLIALGTIVVILLITIVILIAGISNNGSEAISSGSAGMENNKNASETVSSSSNKKSLNNSGTFGKIFKKDIVVDYTAHAFYNYVSGDNKIRNEQRKEQLKGQRLTISGHVAGVGRRFLTQIPYVDLYTR